MSFPLSDHFNGKTFFSPDHVNRTWRDVLQWRRTSRPAPWPAHVPLAPQPPPPAPAADAWVATWIGHATFLVQTAAGNFLTDPQFSDCAGPFGRFGPRRVQPPGLALGDLPRIDFILLSHDHYDHCDLPSLRALARRHDPQVITPLGNAALVRRAGLRRVTELDWWQSTELASPASSSAASVSAATPAPPSARLTLTPARHWSNRLTGRRNARLWGGFMVEFSILDSRFSTPDAPPADPRTPAPAAIENLRSKNENSPAARRPRLWFAGDTGYHDTLFRDIRRRLGAPDLAMIPIGAYAPRWFMAAQHCNPAEAVQIHREIGARQSLAMHWGTWQLTDEAREDPVRALAAALAADGVPAASFRALDAGESAVIRLQPAVPREVGGTPASVPGST